MVIELVAVGGNGDYNMDGSINFSDLAQFLSQFGSTGSGLIGDFNGDQVINLSDLTSFLVVFGITY